jgi:hypothetical protein
VLSFRCFRHSRSRFFEKILNNCGIADNPFGVRESLLGDLLSNGQHARIDWPSVAVDRVEQERGTGRFSL